MGEARRLALPGLGSSGICLDQAFLGRPRHLDTRHTLLDLSAAFLSHCGSLGIYPLTLDAFVGSFPLFGDGFFLLSLPIGFQPLAFGLAGYFLRGRLFADLLLFASLPLLRRLGVTLPIGAWPKDGRATIIGPLSRHGYRLSLLL